MGMEKLWEYTSSSYALPHWKCVLCCCAQCPHIYLPSPESDHHNLNVSTIISFCVYQHIARFNVNDRHPFNESK